MKKPTYKIPTSLAARFVRYLLGFGIGVGINVAAFLGKIPGLDALAKIFPGELRSYLLPFSTLLIGSIAIVVQFYSGETIHRALLRKRFKVSSVCFFVGVIAFFPLSRLLIVDVPYAQGKKTQSFVVGPWRPDDCCPGIRSDRKCIATLGLSRMNVEECWGSGSIRTSETLLGVSYLLLMSGFAGLIGLLLLQEEARRRRPQRAPTARKPREADPAPAPPTEGTSAK